MIEIAHDTDNSHPLTWEHIRGADRVSVGVLIRCAHGHQSTLINPWDDKPDHQIAADGAVSPSAVCTHAGCSWHVEARLLDWTPTIPTRPPPAAGEVG